MYRMKRKVDPMSRFRPRLLIVASALALGVLSGCASVVTFIEGGRFAILTAGVLVRIRRRSVERQDARRRVAMGSAQCAGGHVRVCADKAYTRGCVLRAGWPRGPLPSVRGGRGG